MQEKTTIKIISIAENVNHIDILDLMQNLSITSKEGVINVDDSELSHRMFKDLTSNMDFIISSAMNSKQQKAVLEGFYKTYVNELEFNNLLKITLDINQNFLNSNLIVKGFKELLTYKAHTISQDCNIINTAIDVAFNEEKEDQKKHILKNIFTALQRLDENKQKAFKELDDKKNDDNSQNKNDDNSQNIENLKTNINGEIKNVNNHFESLAAPIVESAIGDMSDNALKIFGQRLYQDMKKNGISVDDLKKLENLETTDPSKDYNNPLSNNPLASPTLNKLLDIIKERANEGKIRKFLIKCYYQLYGYQHENKHRDIGKFTHTILANQINKKNSHHAIA